MGLVDGGRAEIGKKSIGWMDGWMVVTTVSIQISHLRSHDAGIAALENLKAEGSERDSWYVFSRHLSIYLFCLLHRIASPRLASHRSEISNILFFLFHNV